MPPPPKMTDAGIVSRLDKRLGDQEKMGPNSAHVPILRRIVAEMRKGKATETAWGNVVLIHRTQPGKRVFYAVRPWMLALLGEHDLLAAPIET